jgi:hypothetical protein
VKEVDFGGRQIWRRTKEQEQGAEMKARHPYDELEGTALWVALNQAVQDLVDNRDLVEQTTRGHIVGYLCKAVGKETRPTIVGSSRKKVRAPARKKSRTTHR